VLLEGVLSIIVEAPELLPLDSPEPPPSESWDSPLGLKNWFKPSPNLSFVSSSNNLGPLSSDVSRSFLFNKLRNLQVFFVEEPSSTGG
jgi:hypothetical protein